MNNWKENRTNGWSIELLLVLRFFLFICRNFLAFQQRQMERQTVGRANGRTFELSGRRTGSHQISRKSCSCYTDTNFTFFTTFMKKYALFALVCYTHRENVTPFKDLCIIIKFLSLDIQMCYINSIILRHFVWNIISDLITVIRTRRQTKLLFVNVLVRLQLIRIWKN